MLPALLTLWIRRGVAEPAIWRAPAPRARPRAVGLGLGEVFAGGRLRLTIVVTLMNACTLFAWWGFNLWLPGYLSLPAAKGGVGLSPATMSGFVVAMQVGMWLGYVTFGYVSDRIGRRRAYVTYLIAAAVLILVYVSVRSPLVLLLLGPFVAFFATGYFSGFGAVTAEIYPTAIRATAQGLTYNTGPHRQRRRAVRGRHAGPDARLRRRAVDLLGRLPARRGLLALDSGNAGQPAGLMSARSSRVSSEARGDPLCTPAMTAR